MRWNNKGVTLVELILSMTIIGVLALFLLPLLSSGFIGIVDAGHESRALYNAQSLVEKMYNKEAPVDVDNSAVLIEISETRIIPAGGEIREVTGTYRSQSVDLKFFEPQMMLTVIEYYLGVTDPLYPGVGALIITSPYGMRISPYGGDPPELQMHWGTDLAHDGGSPTRFNTPVPYRARITGTGYDDSRGWWVAFEPVVMPLYQICIHHLDNVDVSPGDILNRGDSIGGMGNTGNSTGNHWHIEVRETGLPVYNQPIVGDPEAVLLP